MMQTFVRPSRDLRDHYADISEMLKDHDHVIITNHGRGESVPVSYTHLDVYKRQGHSIARRAVAKQRLFKMLKTAAFTVQNGQNAENSKADLKKKMR